MAFNDDSSDLYRMEFIADILCYLIFILVKVLMLFRDRRKILKHFFEIKKKK